MDNQNTSDRPMYEGDWTCSECGAKITQLPFKPDGTRPLYCKDCHMAKRQNRTGGSSGGQRKMFQGDWTCSECGKKISELPFEPKDDSTILCRDCYLSKRN